MFSIYGLTGQIFSGTLEQLDQVRETAPVRRVRAVDEDGLARRVRDVMSSPVVSAYPATDIRRIARVMLDYGVDGVPVVDADHVLLGFISRSDMLRAVIAEPPVSLWR